MQSRVPYLHTSSLKTACLSALIMLTAYFAQAQAVMKPPGDVRYRSSGDVNAIAGGSFSSTQLADAIKSLKPEQTAAKSGGQTLRLGAGIYRIQPQPEPMHIACHNCRMEGEGLGTSTVHVENPSGVQQPLIRFGIPAGLQDRLLRGGGMSNLTLKTDNSAIQPYGVQLDYTEYMYFENLALENFSVSALYGSFWEANFQNLVFRFAGAGIRGRQGIPERGVLDFDSHAATGLREAPNNTNFTKTTFSSCFGTHIRAAAHSNGIVNIHFFGLYDETYPGDGGEVDNLPIYYFKGVHNFHVTGGFLTVNPTGVNRDGYAVRIDADLRNGMIGFHQFQFLQNHGSGNYRPNAQRRLRSFIYLDKGQQIVLNDVTLNDASGSVGLGLSQRYLIDGDAGSTVFMNNLQCHVRKGVWNTANIISPRVRKQGTLRIIYYDDNGPTGETENINFQLGSNASGDAS